MSFLIIIIFIFLIAGAFFGGIYFRKQLSEKIINSAESEAEKILASAREAAETDKKEIILKGMEEIHNSKSAAEKEIADMRKEIKFQERRVRQKEENAERKIESAEVKERNAARQLKFSTEKLADVEKIRVNQIKELEKVSKLSCDEAKHKIIEALQNELVKECAAKINEFEENLEEEKKEIAKRMLSLAIQRCSAEHTMETTVSVVILPDDDMKGRIIGREGRNIRAIETLTGVDLIIDDTPEAITLSAFDPMRREVARMALEWLIADGRIHPAKIEEAVSRARENVEKELKNEGQRAALKAGVHGLHPDLIKLLGKLKFRTSYGQNVLEHSLEVAYIVGLLAGELGVDIILAKRCGLLHDIGKALNHEMEGSHVDVGVDILKKYRENKDVIHVVASHHENIKPKTEIAVLVQAADAVSAARPGARRENLENYVRRLRKLESIVTEFSGVERCHVVQAGREVRVMISPEVISDDKMVVMAREICKKIEENLVYPGQIKVNMIRESRISELAK